MTTNHLVQQKCLIGAACSVAVCVMYHKFLLYFRIMCMCVALYVCYYILQQAKCTVDVRSVCKYLVGGIFLCLLSKDPLQMILVEVHVLGFCAYQKGRQCVNAVMRYLGATKPGVTPNLAHTLWQQGQTDWMQQYVSHILKQVQPVHRTSFHTTSKNTPTSNAQKSV